MVVLLTDEVMRDFCPSPQSEFRQRAMNLSVASAKITQQSAFGISLDNAFAIEQISVHIVSDERFRPFLNFCGRDGIRTHDLLIANEENSEIRHGAAIT